MTTFRTQVKLGTKYRDRSTGFEGTATAIYFFEHCCERVSLKGLNGHGEIVEFTFDAPELETVSQRKIELIEAKPGGPRERAPRGLPVDGSRIR